MLNEYQELRTCVRNLGELGQKRSAGAVTSYNQFSWLDAGRRLRHDLSSADSRPLTLSALSVRAMR
jgi:hypothetical protein